MSKLKLHVSALVLVMASMVALGGSLTEASTFCIQVITPAVNPLTGECREFPTPCAVPPGWIKVSSCSRS